MYAAGVEEGVAMVSIRAGTIEERLREDPWIAEAKVRVVWPRQIEVMIVEYIPIARVKSGATWLVALLDYDRSLRQSARFLANR